MPKRPPNSTARSGSRPEPDTRRRGAALLVAAVRSYQVVVRPLCPAACRFAPSCSAYAVEALSRHGAIRGALLALRRVAHCHPWHPGGWDPVPGEAAGRGKS